MKTKFIAISLILIGLSSVACRHTEEVLIDQEDQLSLQPEDNQMASKDSTSVGFETNDPPKDPPRDGSHWKTTSGNNDTIKVTPKSFTGIISLDSPSSTTEVIDNGPKDPPRDGSHWRGTGK